MLTVIHGERATCYATPQVFNNLDEYVTVRAHRRRSGRTLLEQLKDDVHIRSQFQTLMNLTRETQVMAQRCTPWFTDELMGQLAVGECKQEVSNMVEIFASLQLVRSQFQRVSEYLQEHRPELVKPLRTLVYEEGIVIRNALTSTRTAVDINQECLNDMQSHPDAKFFVFRDGRQRKTVLAAIRAGRCATTVLNLAEFVERPGRKDEVSFLCSAWARLNRNGPKCFDVPSDVTPRELRKLIASHHRPEKTNINED